MQHQAQRPSLLAPYGGLRPPAPQWFDAALAQAPERSHFEVDGAAIELLVWGPLGAPGLLFLHGNAAHADWWSHIVPAFAGRYRCAAISWSGMGRSDWRERYAIGLYAREILGAIDAAGLAASGVPPVGIAHSFGSFPLLHAAIVHAERLAGVVMVDSLLPGLPPERATASQGRARQYATIADALVRFRFLPEQGSKMPFVVDLMARGGLRRVEQADGGHHFAWCFDPELWPKLRAGSPYIGLPGQVTLPAALIYGEHSAVVSPDRMLARSTQWAFENDLGALDRHAGVQRTP